MLVDFSVFNNDEMATILFAKKEMHSLRMKNLLSPSEKAYMEKLSTFFMSIEAEIKKRAAVNQISLIESALEGYTT